MSDIQDKNVTAFPKHSSSTWSIPPSRNRHTLVNKVKWFGFCPWARPATAVCSCLTQAADRCTLTHPMVGLLGRLWICSMLWLPKNPCELSEILHHQDVPFNKIGNDETSMTLMMFMMMSLMLLYLASNLVVVLTRHAFHVLRWPVLFYLLWGQ